MPGCDVRGDCGRRALAALRAERTRLLNVFQQAHIFFALLEGADHVYSMTNALYDSLIGGREVLGRTVAEALPEVAEQGYIGLLDAVFRTGEPYVANGERLSWFRFPAKLRCRERWILFISRCANRMEARRESSSWAWM